MSQFLLKSIIAVFFLAAGLTAALAMPAFRSLSAQDTAGLLAYLRIL
jgi:hypothetical protein